MKSSVPTLQTTLDVKQVSAHVAQQGYYPLTSDFFTQADFFRKDDAERFIDSFHNLPIDKYMKDNGTYRLRRFATIEYSTSDRALHVFNDRPYYQPTEINSLNGGIVRHFDPMEESIVTDNTFLRGLLQWAFNAVEQLEGPSDWEVSLHQIRILARIDEQGEPAPEGVHRDGVTYIMMMVLARENVLGGESTIYDNDRNLLISTTLQPFDLIFADDNRVMHGVSAILPDAVDGYRDVFVAAFTKKG
ncbi:2OG-Fe dioxygenase family protein [Paenibacillus sp. WQ 127069]|uniref:2OG-Fe dioxygenase family protein n=1 Tax=Paenibacillus baimaensis TaxID=2982185 RepID=A0ABT2UNP1_9BACL|nr:2OG-Fe dioxygenase family protein [Paenibacillus sp. WQ 127069]MCU6796192.1 2OG-Fe dioxygenase family protein [Paenibacillus sp. WQ 127069]